MSTQNTNTFIPEKSNNNLQVLGMALRSNARLPNTFGAFYE